MATKSLTVMFTDIKGFTARVSAAGRDDLNRLRTTHDRLLLPVFRHFEGVVVKTIGDAFLVRFESPTDAVLCGLTIQEVLRRHNATASEKDRLEVRVAINAGEVELTPNDVFGEAVNIAARLEGVAEAGEVYFTESVYLSMNRSEAPSAEIGEHTFKGIPYPVRVYRAVQEADSDMGLRLAESVEVTDHGAVIRGLHQGVAARGRKWTIGAAVLVVVLAGGAAAWFLRPDPIDRALTESADAIAAGDPLRALELVYPELRAHPADAALRRAALQAADAYLDRSGAEPAGSLAWLRATIEERPELEALRARIPILDAREFAAQIRAAENPWPKVRELTARYPAHGEAHYAAAVALEPMSFELVALTLHEKAGKLGAFAGRNDRVLALQAFLQRVFRRMVPGSDSGQIAHALLADVIGPERASAWARRALTEETSGRVIENAWPVLEASGDALVGDPVARALHELVDGFADEAEADASLATLRAVADPARRRQILGLHRWVIEPDVSWGGSHRDLVSRNLGELESLWRE